MQGKHYCKSSESSYPLCKLSNPKRETYFSLNTCGVRRCQTDEGQVVAAVTVSLCSALLQADKTYTFCPIDVLSDMVKCAQRHFCHRDREEFRTTSHFYSFQCLKRWYGIMLCFALQMCNTCGFFGEIRVLQPCCSQNFSLETLTEPTNTVGTFCSSKLLSF